MYEGRGQDRENTGRLHKLKLADKKGSLDSIARHLGMFVDRSESLVKVLNHEESLEELDGSHDPQGTGDTPPAA